MFVLTNPSNGTTIILRELGPSPHCQPPGIRARGSGPGAGARDRGVRLFDMHGNTEVTESITRTRRSLPQSRIVSSRRGGSGIKSLLLLRDCTNCPLMVTTRVVSVAGRPVTVSVGLSVCLSVSRRPPAGREWPPSHPACVRVSTASSSGRGWGQ